MNEQEKTNVLAEFMGWEKELVPDSDLWCWKEKPVEDGDFTYAKFMDWNPLKDWNHWRQVEEKLMEDEKLFLRFLSKFVVLDSVSDGRKSITNYMKSTLEERMDAVISILPTNE